MLLVLYYIYIILYILYNLLRVTQPNITHRGTEWGWHLILVTYDYHRFIRGLIIIGGALLVIQKIYKPRFRNFNIISCP